MVKLKILLAVDREGHAIIINYYFIISKIKKKINLKFQELYQIHLKHLHQQRLLILYHFLLLLSQYTLTHHTNSFQHDKMF